ncbi:hypothetical protein BC829DRAFT_296799 [Chytridium lagenaria]|nr:hypothetical protein BC829DRAFT_296799 [Chytridium lagenaria]
MMNDGRGLEEQVPSGTMHLVTVSMGCDTPSEVTSSSTSSLAFILEHENQKTMKKKGWWEMADQEDDSAPPVAQKRPSTFAELSQSLPATFFSLKTEGNTSKSESQMALAQNGLKQDDVLDGEEKLREELSSYRYDHMVNQDFSPLLKTSLPTDLIEWLPDMVGREDISMADMQDAFILIQLMSMIAPSSVDLAWYTTDEANAMPRS